jgi:hypothetical protein
MRAISPLSAAICRLRPARFGPDFAGRIEETTRVIAARFDLLAGILGIGAPLAFSASVLR